jgi:hypothetical protein
LRGECVDAPGMSAAQYSPSVATEFAETQVVDVAEDDIRRRGFRHWASSAADGSRHQYGRTAGTADTDLAVTTNAPKLADARGHPVTYRSDSLRGGGR